MKEKEIFLTANPDISLMDVLEMQKGTEVIFKSYGREGVPLKILRVQEKYCIERQDLSPIHLKKGGYIAAYKTPKIRTYPNACYLAPLSEKELKEIDNILKERFHTSLKEERKANNLLSIRLLPKFPICQNTLVGIDLNSHVAYKSDGKSKTGLQSIVQMDRDVSFWLDKSSKKTYQAHKDDYFVIILKNKTSFYLAPISKEDVPAIKMLDKKEKILRKYQENKLLSLKTVFHQPRKNLNKQHIQPHVKA